MKCGENGSGWTMDNPYLALIEAIIGFPLINTNKSGEIFPIISDDNLAQYLGDAVVTWKENQDHLHET